MTISESRPNDLVRCRFAFYKPLNCTNTHEFVLKPDCSQTHVTWNAKGNAPFVFELMLVFASAVRMMSESFDRRLAYFFFSSRRRHTSYWRDWSSDVCSSDLVAGALATLKAAQLRGMGGAGFPAAVKWEAVRNATGDEKYVVCNADESEPGTIKDRGILTSVPHLLVEGMALAGVIAAARRGIIYIRHEYGPEARILGDAIAAAHAGGVLGAQVLGSSHAFDLEIFTSPGGYICGEESALLEVLEGRRAQPRLKPPFPVTHGLFGKPTVINTVETLAHVPVILLKGADWYVAQGASDAPGFKFVGVSGHVRRPGIYEIPFGTSLRAVIDEHAGGVLDGRALKAVAPSGASSGFLPAAMADTPIEWGALQRAGSMVGSSAVVAIADGTCMVDLALNVARFFARESCGKCWPCRVGSEKIVQMLEAASEGRAAEDSLAVLDDLAPTLLLTSICGLGQVVPSPITSVLRHFPDEVHAHLKERRCPAGTCRMRPA